MNNLFGKLFSIFILMTSLAASASTVTFNYTGNQLWGKYGTTTQPGDIVTASITFDSKFAEAGTPMLSDVIAWSVATPVFTLNQDTGYLTASSATPFVIFSGNMQHWIFGMRSNGEPYMGAGLTSSIFSSLSDHVSVTPNYWADSMIVGEWTRVTSVPLPAGAWLFASALVALAAGSKRKNRR